MADTGLTYVARVDSAHPRGTELSEAEWLELDVSAREDYAPRAPQPKEG